MVFFDYIYFRVTKAYFKWDGRTGFTAILAVSAMQAFTALGIVFLVAGHYYEVASTKGNKWIVPIGVLFIAIIIVLNFYRYNGRYNKLKSRWKNETEEQRFFRGSLIVISLILPWVFIIAVVINRSNGR